MLYYFLYSLEWVDNFFNVFRYITVRAGLSMITSFLIVAIMGPWTIRRLSALRASQVIRSDGPETHLAKAGTPTMGGVLVIAAILLTSLLWADPANPYIITVLIVTCGFAAVGFADDYLKIRRKDSDGLNGKYKIVLEAAIALAAMVFLAALQAQGSGGLPAEGPVTTAAASVHYKPIVVTFTTLVIPFFKNLLPDLGLFYLLLALVVILGSANAVNLTDGLDGLAIFPVVVVAGTYATFVYLVGRVDVSAYLYLPFIKGAGEVSVFCAAIMGAGLGFLWYNCHPAEVFMGDVGALGLGGAIGTVAVIAKHEIVLVLVGGIFVAEALSVILQVGFFKATGGKRIFRMAPLHHHFEQVGWPEEKVIVRFWIVQVLLALAALATLKLR
jgi:phospho-N-acetylmuramoyl-pentapeptide-transferase